MKFINLYKNQSMQQAILLRFKATFPLMTRMHPLSTADNLILESSKNIFSNLIVYPSFSTTIGVPKALDIKKSLSIFQRQILQLIFIKGFYAITMRIRNIIK